MINISTTAKISSHELKKLITEYFEQHTGQKVTNVSFDVGMAFSPMDQPMGVSLNHVMVTFDHELQQSQFLPTQQR